MTKREFDRMKDGDAVWVACRYLVCPFPGIVRSHDDNGARTKFVRVNLFGHGHVEWGGDALDGESSTSVMLKTVFLTEEEAQHSYREELEKRMAATAADSAKK